MPTAARAHVTREKQPSRNPRVRQIDRQAWAFKRRARFNHSVRFAAAAKATRTALQVTQEELARALDLSTQAIVNRENGFYSWRDEKELARYQRKCHSVAGL